MVLGVPRPVAEREVDLRVGDRGSPDQPLEEPAGVTGLAPQAPRPRPEHQRRSPRPGPPGRAGWPGSGRAPRRRRRSPSPGTIHTQWWSQLIGETSSPVSAQVSSPDHAVPGPVEQRRAHQPGDHDRRVGRQPGRLRAHARCRSSRVMIAGSDWFPSQPTNPVRLPETNSPPSQNFLESAGSTAKPSRTVSTNVPDATAAWRNLRVSSRYGMKISGTSLMPAAMPTPAPLPPPPVRLAQIPDDQRHQHDLDLAQEQRPLHRLGPQQRRGQQQRHAQPGQPAAVSEPAQRQPDRREQGGDVHPHRDLRQRPRTRPATAP